MFYYECQEMVKKAGCDVKGAAGIPLVLTLPAF